jgi:2-oxoisovalerate dehydrogenase E2 component (dihydrolipoyl transacylase)
VTEFVLPDLGEGLREAEIVMWHVGPGDHVVADQPMVSVETDKAVVEIPSPRSGHIARLLAQPGDLVEVGEAIVEFTDGAAADAGAIVGTLQTAAAEPDRHDVAAPSTGRRATPAVRRRAAELGVDLASATPTGPGGTITSADVEAVATGVAAAASDVEPLRGVRRAMDANMSRAHAEVVPATVTDEADIGDWDQHDDVTLRLVRAVARACAVEPALNVSFLGRDVGRRHNDVIDLGVAVDTVDGLFVPVLRDVGHRSPDDLREGLEALKRDVAARTVPAEELKGQTITLSNFGVFAGRHAALVVVPPQVAIVGAGRVRFAVVVHQGQPAVRRVLPVSLTFDHRVVMGSEAARFLGVLVTDLEEAS